MERLAFPLRGEERGPTKRYGTGGRCHLTPRSATLSPQGRGRGCVVLLRDRRLPRLPAAVLVSVRAAAAGGSERRGGAGGGPSRGAASRRGGKAAQREEIGRAH